MNKPKIVTLCGSTRFTNTMLREAWRLTITGVIVIHWNVLEIKEAFSHGAEAAGGNVKEIVDALYLHKIEMADEVRVINVGGYIGDSTRAELRHTKKLGKPITWLEPDKADEEFVAYINDSPPYNPQRPMVDQLMEQIQHLELQNQELQKQRDEARTEAQLKWAEVHEMNRLNSELRKQLRTAQEVIDKHATDGIEGLHCVDCVAEEDEMCDCPMLVPFWEAMKGYQPKTIEDLLGECRECNRLARDCGNHPRT